MDFFHEYIYSAFQRSFLQIDCLSEGTLYNQVSGHTLRSQKKTKLFKNSTNAWHTCVLMVSSLKDKIVISINPGGIHTKLYGRSTLGLHSVRYSWHVRTHELKDVMTSHVVTKQNKENGLKCVCFSTWIPEINNARKACLRGARCNENTRIHILIFHLQCLKLNTHPTSSWQLKQSQSE